jgi:regulator of RNase E activity RraA
MNSERQAYGARRLAAGPLIAAETRDALLGIPTALLSDNMRGLIGTTHLRPLHRGGRMVGSAVTVRVRHGDNLVLHRALDHCLPGVVVVVEAGGFEGQAVTGKIMSRYLESIGAAGLVVDGVIRGADEINKRDFPVFARGVTPRGPYKSGPGEINIVVAIDGMVVAPGYVVVGDADGLVAFPPDDASSLIAKAREQERKEMEGLNALLEGRWDRSWISAAEAKQGLP